MLREREPGLIWPENWTIARVFVDCRWELHLGLNGAHYQGIAAREIEAACRMHAIPRAERLHILGGVRVMEAAARPILNERKTSG